ncbi:hypothetical protein BDC45DRAFT_55261 [Circinella umbellata]|nr:hypothetical protein BDC45DRAFT_55261 [Circinella umbellata]
MYTSFYDTHLFFSHAFYFLPSYARSFFYIYILLWYPFFLIMPLFYVILSSSFFIYASSYNTHFFIHLFI